MGDYVPTSWPRLELRPRAPSRRSCQRRNRLQQRPCTGGRSRGRSCTHHRCDRSAPDPVRHRPGRPRHRRRRDSWHSSASRSPRREPHPGRSARALLLRLPLRAARWTRRSRSPPGPLGASLTAGDAASRDLLNSSQILVDRHGVGPADSGPIACAGNEGQCGEKGDEKGAGVARSHGHLRAVIPGAAPRRPDDNDRGRKLTPSSGRLSPWPKGRLPRL